MCSGHFKNYSRKHLRARNTADPVVEVSADGIVWADPVFDGGASFIVGQHVTGAARSAKMAELCAWYDAVAVPNPTVVPDVE